MKFVVECVSKDRNVRLRAIDAQNRIRSVVFYDFDAREVEQIERGRTYVVTVEEAVDES